MDLAREACQQGLVASISGSTLWRWLHQDAIRPWYHRSWIFPRDSNFADKAGRLLDLYARGWEGKPLNLIEKRLNYAFPGTQVEIPPLSTMFGHPVAMRITWTDGSVAEEEPP